MGAVIAKLRNSKTNTSRQFKNKERTRGPRPPPTFGPGSRRSSYYSSRAAATRSARRKSCATEDHTTETSHFGEAGPIVPFANRLAHLPTIESVDGT